MDLGDAAMSAPAILRPRSSASSRRRPAYLETSADVTVFSIIPQGTVTTSPGGPAMAPPLLDKRHPARPLRHFRTR